MKRINILKKHIELTEYKGHVKITMKGHNGKSISVKTSIHLGVLNSSFEYNTVVLFAYKQLCATGNNAELRLSLDVNYADVFGSPWKLVELERKS